ncbi:MAG: acyl-ACP--UDP-N-acetylglucosamine O-acyltransferase [Gammaproteobacteria bacterium]|nr:acyl-ACP--UDP-N-acetylglucosamine O-acyltransferase [Gammaproteobacteria bacterium]
MGGEASVSIHPAAIVEEGARLGAGCIVHAPAIVYRHADLGPGVVVHAGAVVGGDPQDLKFDPAIESGVRIGARTVLREHVTINRATRRGSCTEVGADCFLMTGSHVAHDSRVGDGVVLANAVLLAGHVQIGDRAFLGGGAVFHQFVRIGQLAMISGGARIAQDVAPYVMAAERNAVIGLNLVGVRRRGCPRATITELKHAFRSVYLTPGNVRELAAAALLGGGYSSAEARAFLEFFTTGKRGFARARRGVGAPDTEE